MSQPIALPPEDLALIAEQEKTLQDVLTSIQAEGTKRRLDRYQIAERLKGLREEAARAKEADLPALFDQMNTQRALVEHEMDDTLPDVRSPYFAHMRLQEGARIKDVLLGHRTFLDGSIPIIDWRHAPISRIFFNYRVGDEYEEELPGRTARGTVLQRNVLTISQMKLLHIVSGGKVFRLLDGQWQNEPQGSLPSLAGGAGQAIRGYSLGIGRGGALGPEVSALLDAEQFALLQADPDTPLLILGGAGCGKTTVALHRLAALNYQSPERFAQESMIVVVPEEGLVRLSRRLLNSLHLHKVQVTTFDQWVAHQARLLIRNLPTRINDLPPSHAVTIKRHPAMRAAYAALVARQAAMIQHKLEHDHHIPAAQTSLLLDESMPILHRLERLEDQLTRSLPSGQGGDWQKIRVQHLQEFFRKQKRRLSEVGHDRLELYTRPEILQAICAASDGQINDRMTNMLMRHTLEQFESSMGQKYAHIDADKLETADGKSLLDEVENELAGSIDQEDFTVLLDLLYFKTGTRDSRVGKMQTYSHVVIDEAQDLSPLELAVMGRSVRDGSSVTIAGDAAQQVDPATCFESWERVLDHLGLPRVHGNHLTTTYRSTRPIAEFAHGILGSFAPKTPPRAIKDGVPVMRGTMPSDGHVTIMLTDTLTQLMVDEPQASVAIITKEPEMARRFYSALEDIPKIRLVLDGEFDFRPGIDVTTAQQVKGLEFDYVIIPDASAGIYRDTPEDRRLLHVAATRAIHQLWVISMGKECPILPRSDADSSGA